MPQAAQPGLLLLPPRRSPASHRHPCRVLKTAARLPMGPLLQSAWSLLDDGQMHPGGRHQAAYGGRQAAGLQYALHLALLPQPDRLALLQSARQGLGVAAATVCQMATGHSRLVGRALLPVVRPLTQTPTRQAVKVGDCEESAEGR